MKKFLTKTITFLFNCAFAILILFLLIKYISKKNTNFLLNNEYEYVIIGNSYSETAFNDNLILNFKNLSTSGQAYFYQYLKIKEVLKTNNVKTLFVEFSNTDILIDMDSWIFGKEKTNTFMHQYYPFMSESDWLYFYNGQKFDFHHTISSAIKNSILEFFIKRDININNYFGGYLFLDRNNIEQERYNLKNDSTYKNFHNKPISSENIIYLKKIVNLCDSLDVNIFFVRSPVHKLFVAKYNENELINIQNETFENIDILNFSNFELEDECFADFGHLNYKGANKFSDFFNKLLTNGLLNKENIKELIKVEINKFNSSSLNTNHFNSSPKP
tara:strand:- start:110 stop:1099 length:990 start_codon:yes stop_codon:yes gene_type:complete